MSYMRALEPGEPCEVWLMKHDDTPAESRPVCLTRAPSGREQRRLHRDFDAVYADEPEADEIAERMLDLFCTWVIGWRNITGEFSRDAVEDRFTYHGQREIVARIMNGAIGAEDKKKFE